MTTETVSNLLFANDDTVNGSFNVNFTGTAPVSVSTFSFTVVVNGKTVTINNSDATATINVQSWTGANGTGQPLYQIYFLVNSNSAVAATVSKLYLDFTPDATSLYTGSAPSQPANSPGNETNTAIEVRYTSITDDRSTTASPTATNGGGTLSPATPCFMAGTRILTAEGEIAVEAITAGTMVVTQSGNLPVRWLGRSTVSTRFADPLRALPIRIKAGALGEGLPVRDLRVSPDHAMLINNVLVQAGALVNGSSIIREASVPEVFTYYHVELASHEVLMAEGAATESFIDNVDRMGFDNWAEHEALGDTAPIMEMPYPRAKSARQVPMSVRGLVAEQVARMRVEEMSEAA
jgi:hypothetical protein